MELPRKLDIAEIEFGWDSARFGSLRMANRYAQVRENIVYVGGTISKVGMWLMSDHADVIIAVHVSGPNREYATYALKAGARWPDTIPTIRENIWIGSK